jgi:hypothetical protein
VSADDQGAGLSPAERAALRQAMVRVLDVPDDAPLSIHRFLPLEQHAQVLAPHKRLIVGDRGAGKTALFHAFTAATAQGIALDALHPALRGLPAQRWLAGHDQSAAAPLPDQLGALPGDPAAARLWWVGRALQVLAQDPIAPPLPAALLPLRDAPPGDVPAVISLVRAETGPALTWLHALDAALGAAGLHLALSYDYLDRLSPDDRLASAADVVRPLIALWADLAPRLHHIGPKLLLRPDLHSLSVRGAVDATKWVSATVDLRWGAADLLRALLRHLGADDAVRAWLEREPGGLQFTAHPELGWMPPEALPELPAQLDLFPYLNDVNQAEDAKYPTQLALGVRLAGEVTQTAGSYSFTHRWMVESVRDSTDRAHPRSLLSLLRAAAQHSLHEAAAEPPGLQLLWPHDIVAGLVDAGTRRLGELEEEEPTPVRAARAQLRGLLVPLNEEELRACFGEDALETIEALQRLGLLRQLILRSGDGGRAFEVPELFRAALGLRRRGGVRRAPPA